MSNNPNLLRSWTEWEIKDGQWKTIVVVETDIDLNPRSVAVNEQELNALVQAAVDLHGDSHATTFRIVPKGTN